MQEAIDAAAAVSIHKLSTTTVNTNTGTKQSLYTVPSGKIFIPTHVVVRAASADLSDMAGALNFGFNANADDCLTIPTDALASLSMSAKVIAMSLFMHPAADNYTSFPRGAAADVFGCKFLDTSVTGTVKIDTFGYLLDA